MSDPGPPRKRRRLIRRRHPLIITVPRGLLRRSLQQIIPGKSLRVSFIINGSEIKPFSPSETWGYDISRVQHLTSYHTGFRNLRSPSPSIMYPYEFSTSNQDNLPQRPECPPEHGRYFPTPFSPRFLKNPVHRPPSRSISVRSANRLPQNRKFMSQLAKRRGVEIDPMTGEIKIIRRRTHADLARND
uniref:Uncharacterized protein n=1 Tax=Setaria digitata TaxID=48799 RepID=A0A915PKM7_9BILA